MMKTLWHLARGGKGDSHEQRLTNFYAPQAESYDSFREKLLHGRADLIDALNLPDGARVADFGGGTGRNLEFYGEGLRSFAQVDVVDLCQPLLAIAQQRVESHGWSNVRLHHQDVTTFAGEAPYDAITFSYSLSMIPVWREALHHAICLLKPGGIIGLVDFYVSTAEPTPNRKHHSWLTRTLWPWWFRHDNVHLRPELLATLDELLDIQLLKECRGRLPLTPFTVPHCVVIGRKPTATSLPD